LSPPNTSAPAAKQSRDAPTCSPGSCAAGSAGGGWNRSWANRRPGYRCRHGRTSASTPEPGQPRNAYLREDHLLPHLPALVLRIAAPGSGRAPTTAAALEHLRAGGIGLTYDAAARTLTADTE